jgi:hypothetical protein
MTLTASSEVLDAGPHEAFYAFGEPVRGDTAELDTGLHCWCGREVVNVINDDEGDFPTGWAHVGEE